MRKGLRSLPIYYSLAPISSSASFFALSTSIFARSSDFLSSIFALSNSTLLLAKSILLCSMVMAHFSFWSIKISFWSWWLFCWNTILFLNRSSELVRSSLLEFTLFFEVLRLGSFNLLDEVPSEWVWLPKIPEKSFCDELVLWKDSKN